MFCRFSAWSTSLAIFTICTSIFLYPGAYYDSFLSCVAIPKGHQKGCENQSFGKTFFSIRPQDSNSALRIAKIVSEDHNVSWGFELSAGSQQSFARKNNLLAQWFLFNGCSTVTIGIPDTQNSFTVDGRQLGLMTQDGTAGPIGTFSLCPTIKNDLIIGNAWVDLSDCVSGLWFRTFLTIVRARTDLAMRASTKNSAQSGTYPSGAYTTDCQDAPLAYSSICSAFKGNKAFGTMPALEYGKFYSGSKTKTALASVRADLNYDFIQSERGFFNAGGCFLIPTGNKPHALYLFEPIVGANGCWQVGATLLGAYHCLPCQNTTVDLYVDATATYLAKSKQTRVFSLKTNGAGSQYMLLKVFDLSISSVQAGERVANIFAGQADIGGNAMFDGSLMVHIAHSNGISFDVGYNLWARSAERIGDTACLRKLTQNTYGVKGNQPLSITDSFSGLCIGDLTTASHSTIGNPAPADDLTELVEVCDINFNAPLNPSAFSNKLFACIGYEHYLCNSNSTINLFIEGEVEIGQKQRALNQWAVNINVALSL